MQKPEVSIITPCYNARNYISQCMTSVQSQDLKDWEHLIVDDQSDDGSREIISDYARGDNRIKLISSSNKLGASKARNLAIQQAKGRFIAFLDADDWWPDDKLSKQVTLMKDAKAVFSCTSYNVVDNTGATLRTQKIESLNSRLLLCKRAVVGCLTVLYSREYFKKFRFSEDMKAAEDYEMWCRMLIFLERNGHAAEVLSEPLAYYRVHPGGKSKRKLRRIWIHYRLYRDRLNLSTINSLYCTLGYIANGVIDRVAGGGQTRRRS